MLTATLPSVTSPNLLFSVNKLLLRSKANVLGLQLKLYRDLINKIVPQIVFQALFSNLSCFAI